MESTSPRLILASASPRRVALLGQIGLKFEISPSGIEEEMSALQDGMPEEMVKQLALKKAEDVARRLGEGIVLGADTVVVLDGEVLGKPRDEEDAKYMLRRLSGRSHDVITGVGVVDAQTGRTACACEVTKVRCRELTEQMISQYVATGEPMDKAGAYAAQGIGAVIIQGIYGCYFNVVGLPLGMVAEMLEEFGVRVLG